MELNGKEFAEHRAKIVKIFHDNNIKEGHILYKADPTPEEPYTGSNLHFYQEALFFWLTGWSKPSAVIEINLETGLSTLLVPALEPSYEIWFGPIPLLEDVKKQTGVDKVGYLEELPKLIEDGKQIYGANKQIEGAEDTALLSAAGIARRVKSEAEIAQLRHASELTSDAAAHVMRNVEDGWAESEVDCEFTYYGYKHGAVEKSFLTIAASGQNSVYLHSEENSGVCHSGDLLLLDCGFFWNHYAGDVTRTFPVNGKFSDDQKLVYNLLLAEQLKLIENVKPGQTFQSLNDQMFRAIFGIAQKLGAIKEGVEYSRELALLFCPHSLTHHVGCNVHDHNYWRSSLIKDSLETARFLVPNMEITIEPGIYFHKKRYTDMKNRGEYADVINWDVAIRYANSVAGIRIEDDVLVTEEGHQVISTCPKTIEAIEKIMAK